MLATRTMLYQHTLRHQTLLSLRQSPDATQLVLRITIIISHILEKPKQLSHYVSKLYHLVVKSYLTATAHPTYTLHTWRMH